MKADLEYIETARLRLEPITTAHAAELFAGLSDRRLYRYYAGVPPASVDELARQYAQLSSQRSPDGKQIWLNWAMRDRGGDVVGRLQATIVGRTAIIGYDVFVPFWRRGFAKEGAAAMLESVSKRFGVRRAEAIVDTENVASIALLRSLGFRCAWTGPSDDMAGRMDHRYERRLSGT
ncbi:MAG: GNAT family N-acetyltransferase [Candidatus Eremiobacteraeota bacterium]|nr:GNAT family N-acetyltransferase [Candidatus Eremiobacteraeota bacterium]